MDYDAAKLDEIVLALLYLNVSTTARLGRASTGIHWIACTHGVSSQTRSRRRSRWSSRKKELASQRSHSGGTLDV
jgi:hypothetical protein